MSTFESIAKVISDYREMDPEEITLNTTFEDLALDSLDMTEILMGLEDEFGITIEPEESETSRSVERPPARTTIFIKVSTSFF